MKAHRTLVALSLLVAASVAHAQPAQDELRDAGRKVMEEASAAAAKKDWATCRTKAAGVWDTTKHFKVAGLLGSCELELGMHADAADHLAFYLAHDDRSDAGRTQGVQQRYDRALKEVAAVDVRCAEPDAVVDVAGKPIGAPRVVHLAPGSHTVSATKSGFAGEPQSVTVTKGEKRTLTIVLRPVAPASSASAAPTTAPTASVVAPPVPSGSSVDPPPSGKAAWPAVVLFGAGAVAAGVGVGLSVAGESERSSVVEDAKEAGCNSRRQPCADAFQDRLADADTLSNVGIALFAVAGAAILGGVIYVAIPSSEEPSVEAAVMPWFTTQGAGAALRVAY